MFNIEEIRQESILHSNAYEDWSPEATIKEFIWASRSYEKNQTESNFKRHSIAVKAIYHQFHKYNPDMSDVVISATLSRLNYEDFLVASYPGASLIKRNEELRRVEQLFGIKNPISDWFF